MIRVAFGFDDLLYRHVLRRVKALRPVQLGYTHEQSATNDEEYRHLQHSAINRSSGMGSVSRMIHAIGSGTEQAVTVKAAARARRSASLIASASTRPVKREDSRREPVLPVIFAGGVRW